MMARNRTIAACLLLVGTVACGDRRNDDLAADSLAPADSLVPIADASPLTDSTRLMPPAETVYVAPPITRPAPARAAPRRSPAPSPSPSPAPAPAPSRGLTVDAGTSIATTAMQEISSDDHKVGDIVNVRVSNDVLGANGRVAIPAGSVISLSIVAIADAENRGERGTLVMSARNVSINGSTYSLNARASDYTYKMSAGKIGAEQVATTGAGAVAGAVIGRVIGGKTGTAVGAVGGAAAGAAVAAKKADRHIVVEAGNSVTLTLREDFSRS